MDFAVPADHSLENKENEKRVKYFDLARELRKLWNIRGKLLPVVTGELGIIPKGLERGLEEFEISRRIEIILCSVGWSCRIHWLLLCRGVGSPLKRVSWYATKQFVGEAPVMLELWEMRSTPLLPLLPGPL